MPNFGKGHFVSTNFSDNLDKIHILIGFMTLHVGKIPSAVICIQIDMPRSSNDAALSRQ